MYTAYQHTDFYEQQKYVPTKEHHSSKSHLLLHTDTDREALEKLQSVEKHMATITHPGDRAG